MTENDAPMGQSMKSENNSGQEQLDNFIKLAKRFETAMLVTYSGSEQMHARPMWIAEFRDDATVSFVTNAQSLKASEIAADSDVGLVFQGGGTYLAARGQAAVVHDQALIDRLWQEPWRVWFPQGKQQSDLRIITVTLHDAEYWDNSGIEGIKYAFSLAKAYGTGTRPHVSDSQHGKVQT